jgi:replicative DNA helicase
MIELEKEKARGGIIETGFEVIDKVVGAKAGDVLLLVMPTKRGKTQSMLRMQKHAIDHEIPSIYFSLEMSLIEMTNRIIASYGKYKFNDLKFFRVKPEEYKAELERVKKTPTHIVTRANESRIDLATIEKYIQEHKPRVVFIDYLMLIDGCDFNWSADVRPMAELKKIAQQNRCLIVVSQQADTQTMSGDDIPELTNVRGDKSISYDCNIFVGGTSTRMVNDENDPEDMVKLKFKYAVRASRDGKCPHFAYRVIPETGEWTDISEEIDL